MSVRLGAGDLVANGPNTVARILFLQAVERCVPEALRELAAIDPADDPQFIDWSKRRGFTDAWAVRQARNHLGLWHEHPDLIGRWLLFPMTVHWEPTFLTAPSWNPITEPEAAYRARLDDYIVTIREMPGLAATPDKRRVVAHFEWLALHHVGRLTYEDITERYENADGNPNEPATIGRAIVETAFLIGLTLRPAHGRKSQQPSQS